MANDRKEKLEKLRAYLSQASERIQQAGSEAINCFDMAYFYNFNCDHIPHYIYAIYDASGILPMRNNRYITFVDVLYENMDIYSGNILEVGGGTMYRTALIIAKKIRGTITVYDKQLYTTESPLPNLKLCREEFTASTNLEPYDLIVGQYPCQATELMVERSMQENKGLFIQICKCVHRIKPFENANIAKFGHQSKLYQEKVINYYKEYAKLFDRSLSVHRECNLTDPIIYSLKK